MVPNQLSPKCCGFSKSGCRVQPVYIPKNLFNFRTVPISLTLVEGAKLLFCRTFCLLDVSDDFLVTLTHPSVSSFSNI